MFDYKIGILVALSAWFFVYIKSQGPGSGVGGSCFEPLDCGLWHFECENGVCRCNDEHIPDRENKWCAVDILQPCGYHDPCFDSNAYCEGEAFPKYGTCQCKKGYTLHEKKRVCSVVIGNNCSSSEDCIEGSCALALPCTIESAACNYTQCFCNNALKPDTNGTKCRPALHDDCSQFLDCAREHSSCKQVGKENLCKCDSNYKEASRKNEINQTETFCFAKLDIRCQNTTDCADSGAICVEKNETTKMEPPACRKNKNTYWPDYPPKDPPKKYCVCEKSYVRHPEPGPDTLDVSECLKVATKEHDNCTHNIQCTAYSGFGSECEKGNCRCRSGFYFDVDFDRCVRSCLCPDDNVKEIAGVLKDLAPTFELLAKNNNMDISRVLKKIEKLSN